MKTAIRSVLLVLGFIGASTITFVAKNPRAVPPVRAVQTQPATQLPAVEFFTPANAEPTCAPGSIRCGNLEKNGTCCNSADRCCYVNPELGNCYCVAQGDRCNRY